MRGNQPFKSSTFKDEDLVALKIKGLPYSTTFEEVSDFFKNFQYIEKSVVLGLGRDGRKNGFGTILFEDEKEAKDAMTEMQGQYVGNRYVDLTQISYGDYSRFNGPPAGNYGGNPGSYVKLSKYVSPENQEKCILMRGCPYRIEAKEIVAFFDGYGSLTPEDIFIEESNGRRTGSALVIFENKEIAQDAKAALNKKNIGEEQRYVELHDCNDLFMKKVCHLFDEDQDGQPKQATPTAGDEEEEKKE